VLKISEMVTARMPKQLEQEHDMSMSMSMGKSVVHPMPDDAAGKLLVDRRTAGRVPSGPTSTVLPGKLNNTILTEPPRGARR
jgi:hypothetical protein